MSTAETSKVVATEPDKVTQSVINASIDARLKHNDLLTWQERDRLADARIFTKFGMFASARALVAKVAIPTRRKSK